MCTKIRFPSREFAESNIADLKRKKREPVRRSKRLNAYVCRDCHYWHVGHRRLGY